MAKAKGNSDKCISCGACVNSCPVGAIKLVNNKATIDPKLCVGCGTCAGVCPVGAIDLKDE